MPEPLMGRNVLTAATMCSGIGAPETAVPEWNWLWCAENDAFPSAVLSARFGHANIGDMVADSFSRRAAAAGIPRVIVAGTPCQAFSVAGARKGLGDDRGNLTLIFTRICNDLVEAARISGRPRPCILWENVPGVLSDDTNAFGCFLAGLVGADDALSPPRGQSWPDAGMVSGPRARTAWRVLDAQHFGVPQRRERVFVVVDFGDGPDPAAVLFERARLPGDYSPRRKEKKSVAAGDLGAFGGGSLWRRVAEAFADPRFKVQELAGTLGARSSGGCHPGGGKDGAPSEIAAPLAVEDDRGDQSPLIAAPALAINLRGRDGGINPELDDLASLRAASGGSTRSYVSFHGRQDPDISGDIAPPLGTNHGQECALVGGWAIRRLTPTECARLQGFPDDHSRIAWRSRAEADCPDGPQYKAYGNSMAVPVIRWICKRIEVQLKGGQ